MFKISALYIIVYNARQGKTFTHLKVSLDVRRTTWTTSCFGGVFLREISVTLGWYPWKRLPAKSQSWSLPAGVCSKLMTWDQLERGFTEKFHLDCLTSNPNFCCVLRKMCPLPYVGRKTNTTCLCILVLLFQVTLIFIHWRTLEHLYVILLKVNYKRTQEFGN